jgi:hypothetical protein
MAPASPPDEEEEEEADDDWAIARVFALVELWALIAQHSGLVGAWRLKRVCKAAREGAKVWLRTLPGLVVCGGFGRLREITNAVWRLDLGKLRWERMSDLVLPRAHHVSCAVRGGVVVLGGKHTWFKRGENEMADCFTASVEVLDNDSEVPPLSRGPRVDAAAVAIDESESEQGHVLHIGGGDGHMITSAVQKVDLATGECTRFLLSFLVGDRFARLRSCQTGASFA